MSLIDAPEYDPTRDNRIRNVSIGLGVAVLLFLVLSFLGVVLGHGWLFTDLPAEHRVDRFFTALEAKDYNAAYSLYVNGHPDSGYPLPRFTEDWTTYSPVKGAITSHHVDKSATDGTGFLGTGIIVGVTVNGSQRVNIGVTKADGTMTVDPPHVLVY